MPLTDLERNVAKAVAQNYLVSKEAMSHELLLRRFEDPRPIIKLQNSRVILANNDASDPKYLPTILAFELSGDESLKQLAKGAVETVTRDLKHLFKSNFQTNRDYDTATLAEQLRAPNYEPDLGLLVLGMFLSSQIGGVFGGFQGDERGQIERFRISQHILTLDPAAVWADYVRAHLPADLAPEPPRQDKAFPPPKPEEKSGWPPPEWKIVRSLGEGRQGWTFEVRRRGDANKNSFVLKRLKNKERLTRFQSEISALTKLQHPGILKIVETSTDPETPFFVAEYCDGLDLGKADLSSKDLLDRLVIFRQICDAVAAAHNAGILHRDLKPPNIFLRKDNSIVVGDFGLCIDLNDAKERATQTMEGVGAERYIAPEVAKGRVPEPQPVSDIYSLGKVLYFILSGKTLLREEYAEGEDDLRTPQAQTGMHFVYELFDKTIRDRPQDRFQSVGDLLYAVDSVIERVRLRAHVLKPSMRQPCMFCVVGEYQRASGGAAGAENLFICHTCGNIQRFTGTPAWWERK